MQPIIAFLMLAVALVQNGLDRPQYQPGSTAAAIDDYRIGRDDLIEVSVFDVPALAGTFKVGGSNTVSLPLVGDITVTGKTPREVSKDIENLLKPRFVNDPHVTVIVREYGSQPVSVIGAVRVPGIYQIKGTKSLMDIIAMAQGLGPDADTIQVVRHKAPSATQGGDDQLPPFSTILIDAEDLVTLGKTELNIPVLAGDVINVTTSKIKSIFVVGEVIHSGEFSLKKGQVVTATQALALGGGFTRDSSKRACSIMRYRLDRSKEEIPVDLSAVMAGTKPDVEMMPNDILYVPANKTKTGINRTLDTVISIAIGRAIYK